MSKWVALARKAVHRDPRFVARRAAEELRRQAFRPWGRVRPLVLTDARLLAATASSSIDDLWQRLVDAPFPISPGASRLWADRFQATQAGVAETVLAEADRVLRHEFDLLGSGPLLLGSSLPWGEDFKVGRRWDLRYGADIDYNDLDKPSDVKVPWELSRCQHFSRLGQAYWLTGDQRYATEFVEEIGDWISANPWTRGVNWACTMDIALRAISWIWALRFFADAPPCRARSFRSLFLRNLFLHGEYIAGHIEVSDLNGNHYLVDGLGLVFLGLAFRGAGPAAGWLGSGRRILVDEIHSQVWADGVDFEQSVAYHRLVLEAFLTGYFLLRRSGEDVPAAAWSRLERMLEFVAAYTKPDGQAPLIGDADDGRVQKFGVQDVNDHRYLLSTGAVLFRRPDLKRAAGKFWDESFWLLGPEGSDGFEALPDAPSPPSAAFPEGGFYVMRGRDTHLIVDCGEVGMRGRGGHGHNDVLSFELFLSGGNLVTDCGAYVYTASREWRNRFRSTAFHNTVQVDGQELNRFISAEDLWRLRDDAHPLDVTWRSDSCFDYLRAAHDGYDRLSSPVRHTREILLDKVHQRVVFRDILDGNGLHQLAWRFHLDPAVQARVDGNRVHLTHGARQSWLSFVDAPSWLALRIESGWVSRSYGRKIEAPVVVIECERRVPLTCVYCFSPAALSSDELKAAAAGLETRA